MKQMNNTLGMIMKVNCENGKEVKIITKEISKFIRRIKYIKNEELNYEGQVVNLESGTIKTIVNRKEPREVNL